VPRVTFLPGGEAAEVAPGTSLLDAADAAGAALPHNCGGVCACVTCHLWIEQGLGSLSPATEREDDKLDEALGLTAHSRLACQARVGEASVVARIPGNRIAS
jgi:2Fe-2S ferredoxin